MATATYVQEGTEEFVSVETVNATQRPAQRIEDIVPARFRTTRYIAYIRDEAAKRGVTPGVVLADEMRAHYALKNADLWPSEDDLIARVGG
ncbi:MAG: hypothetical protein H0T51_20850 [Pirellulales bacterium]|nr:hypothetical protein [Pirellulales bacterium]